MKTLILFYGMRMVMFVQSKEVEEIDITKDEHRNEQRTSMTKSVTETENDYSEMCMKAICFESSICTHNESTGCIAVASNNPHATHRITVSNETSVILFQLHLMNESSLTDGHLILEFHEFERRPTKWNFVSGEKLQHKPYTSLQSELIIHIKAEGSWKDVIFTYEELEFEIQIENVTDDSGVLAPSLYRANTLILYYLTPELGRWNESSIMIIVKMIVMDEISGEYILIGAGTEPFVGPPALFLTGKITKPEKYYVVTDNAYITAFIRTSNQNSRLQISWKRSGNRLQDPDDDTEKILTSDSVLQAVQICLYDLSIIQEFNCTRCEEEPLPKFRAKIAEFSNNYAREKKLNYEVKPKQIKLFRVSSILISDDYSIGTVYVMMTIVQEYDKNTAAFQRHQILEILERFYSYDKANNHALLGFKIGKCPQTANYYWWFTTLAIVLLFCIFLFTAVWILTYNMMWKSKKSKEEKRESNHSLWKFDSEINEHWILRKRSLENKGKVTRNKRIWMEWKTDVADVQETASRNGNTENTQCEYSESTEDEDTYF